MNLFEKISNKQNGQDDAKIIISEEYIMDLLSRMTVKEEIKNSKDSIRWKAYREAEKINDAAVYPILIKIVKENQQVKKKDLRDAVYFIIGVALRNVFDREACIFLIGQLENETNKYINSSILDRISEINIPKDVDISLILVCSKNDKWQIRQSALRALGSCETNESRKALLYYINQDDDTKYRYEITYANASLGKIGIMEDIPFLEKHVKSRKMDVRDSAKYAIESIKNRFL